MFGLSKKEKVLKLVSKSVDACLDDYRAGLKELIIKEMTGEISQSKFEELRETLQKEYNTNVSEHAINAFSREYPEQSVVARQYVGYHNGMHKLYSHLCKAMTGQEVGSIDQYSMMTAQQKGFEAEEQAIRDSLSK